MDRNQINKSIILGLLLISIAGIAFVLGNKSKPIPIVSNQKNQSQDAIKTNIATFKSEQEFKEYLAKSSSQSGFGFGGGMLNSMDSVVATKSLSSPAAFGGSQEASRVSQTNVQVSGIDEPDIVKTDGSEIYLSRENQNIFYPMMERSGVTTDDIAGSSVGASEKMIAPNYPDIYPYPVQKNKTSIIKSFPPSELASKKISSIDKSGNLLLSNGILVVFSGQDIIGYDVTDTKNPKEVWKESIKDNSSLVSARLFQGKIYAVTRTSLNMIRPCPIEPMMSNGVAVSISCGQIYHPINPVSSDVTFDVVKIDIKNGNVEKASSFVGSSNESTVYATDGVIYVANVFQGNMLKFVASFFSENKGLLPQEIIDRLVKLNTYDISDTSKMTEMGMIMQQYQSSLGNDDKLKMQNEIQNKMKDYAAAHVRELEKTGIAKIDMKDLSVLANGEVPGRILNQFSLDEYEGNLRIATTVGGGWLGMGFGGGSSTSLNDVYVLDAALKNIGSVKDLGKGERIYATRFIEDKAYVVTFKQTDPFYVLDLSDGKNPQLKGELKIPGYSSYLHPISKNIILGIGKEEGNVKLSLFDVSAPENPKEISKYNLDEYWSEAENDHHAFLQDEKHKIFFIPGSKGGYVFSYEGNNLTLAKAVSDYQIKRAVYMNDFLYMIGENKISAFDEKNWQKVGEVDLQ
jgi:uncharacterized secreted protein with C-terminal beta-propeller domain